ncbi:hypothetical protein B0H19DRAFT_1082435 [Mycena capillaripes]|nr:hypothetical protein B0H19DRAFT_1082435 [Mycena capillaripes]
MREQEEATAKGGEGLNRTSRRKASAEVGVQTPGERLGISRAVEKSPMLGVGNDGGCGVAHTLCCHCCDGRAQPTGSATGKLHDAIGTAHFCADRLRFRLLSFSAHVLALCYQRLGGVKKPWYTWSPRHSSHFNFSNALTSSSVEFIRYRRWRRLTLKLAQGFWELAERTVAPHESTDGEIWTELKMIQ